MPDPQPIDVGHQLNFTQAHASPVVYAWGDHYRSGLLINFEGFLMGAPGVLDHVNILFPLEDVPDLIGYLHEALAYDHAGLLEAAQRQDDA